MHHSLYMHGDIKMKYFLLEVLVFIEEKKMLKANN